MPNDLPMLAWAGHAVAVACSPWALRGISERLLEAVDRGLGAEPAGETVLGLKRTFLGLEGDRSRGP